MCSGTSADQKRLIRRTSSWSFSGTDGISPNASNAVSTLSLEGFGKARQTEMTPTVKRRRNSPRRRASIRVNSVWAAFLPNAYMDVAETPSILEEEWAVSLQRPSHFISPFPRALAPHIMLPQVPLPCSNLMLFVFSTG